MINHLFCHDSSWNQEAIKLRKEGSSKLRGKERWKLTLYWAKVACNRKGLPNTRPDAEVLQRLFMVLFRRVVSKCGHLEEHKYRVRVSFYSFCFLVLIGIDY